MLRRRNLQFVVFQRVILLGSRRAIITSLNKNPGKDKTRKFKKLRTFNLHKNKFSIFFVLLCALERPRKSFHNSYKDGVTRKKKTGYLLRQIKSETSYTNPDIQTLTIQFVQYAPLYRKTQIKVQKTNIKSLFGAYLQSVYTNVH